MAGTKVGSLDIQFQPTFDSVKANQLVQSLQQVINAVNTLALKASGTTPEPTTVPVHALAGQSGLGPSHSVAGLTADEVLVATSATEAHFAKLTFGQIAGTDSGTFLEPTNGDVIAFINGYWSAISNAESLGLADPGTDAVVMWDETANSGAGGLVWALPGPNITLSSGRISASFPPTPTTPGDTPLTWLSF